VVLAAGQRASGEAASTRAHEALEVLCRAYWFPIYVYVRRKGYGPDDAEDLTQEFFAQLIEKQSLRLADREKGRFRTFLLAVLDYFLANDAAASAAAIITEVRSVAFIDSILAAYCRCRPLPAPCGSDYLSTFSRRPFAASPPLL
jgi:RNA polymerase sigma-70 factor (ECF subfamily)